MEISIKNKSGVLLKTAKKHCSEDITVRVETSELVVTPTTENQEHDGLYTNVIVAGDENLVSENIAKDVTIFGVTGTHEGGGESEYNATLKSPNNVATFNFKKWITEMTVLDLAGANDITSAFNGCSYLVKVGNILNGNNVTKAENLFYDCTRLTEIGNLNFPNVTKTASMFYNCIALKKAPEIDVSKVPTLLYVFYNCASLTAAPNLNMLIATTAMGMFYGCTNLKTVPSYEAPRLMNSSKVFYNCTNLTTVGELNFPNVSNITSMFYNCTALKDFGGLTNLGQAYTQTTTNYSNYTLDLSASTQLTHDSLMNVINKLYDLNLTYNVAGGGTLYTQKLMLGSTNLEKLTAEEIRNSDSKADGLYLRIW